MAKRTPRSRTAAKVPPRSTSAPLWKQWLKESAASQKAVRRAVRNDPEATTIVEAAVGRLRQRARDKSARESLRAQQHAAYLEWVNARSVSSTERWTLDHVLTALTTWDRGAALWALGLPIVQYHMADNRIGREPAKKQARQRFEQAIVRLLTDGGNKGGRGRAPALRREDVEPVYRSLIYALEAVKRKYYDDDDGWAYAGADAEGAVNGILSDFLIPPPKTARDWLQDLAGKPSDVATDMLTKKLGTSRRRVKKATTGN